MATLAVSHSRAVQWPRSVSLIDLSVAVLALIAVALPSRTADAVPAFDATATAEIARAEARAFARPDDGEAAADLARALVGARQLDWALDRAHLLAAAQAASPSRWRSYLGVSIAHAERLEAPEALAWSQRSLAACAEARATCPSWEEVRVQLYAAMLDAGVRSGIDQRVDPVGFRRAAEAGVTQIRLSGGPQGDGQAPR